MNNSPEDFISDRGVHPKEEGGWGYTRARVLPELIGAPWCDTTLRYVLGMSPTSIRVSHGALTLDAETGRVTVIVDRSPERIIQEITMEIPLPGEGNGHKAAQELERLKAENAQV